MSSVALAAAAHTGSSNNHAFHSRCPLPLTEHLFRLLIGGLFAEHLMPPGSIVDAGSNTGEESCFYAESNPDRKVHAIDPASQNVELVRSRGRHLPNLHAAIGGLGTTCKWLSIGPLHRKRPGLHTQLNGSAVSIADGLKHPCTIDAAARTPLEARGLFMVQSLDALFAADWAGERFGFGHFDVEGGELDVVEGAANTIERDRPVFTVEISVHGGHGGESARLDARRLLTRIAELGYTSFVVDEQCGEPADLRNVINLPTEQLSRYRRSNIFQFAAAASVIHRVTNVTIGQHAFANVCARGKVCCLTEAECCRWQCVREQKELAHAAWQAGTCAGTGDFSPQLRKGMAFAKRHARAASEEEKETLAWDSIAQR